MNNRPTLQHTVKYCQTGSFTTRYLDVGDPVAETVILLHDGAWGGSSEVSWSACLPTLAERYHVIAPDFVGFGGSDKVTYFDRSPYEPRIRQVENLVDQLRITGPTHVVGTSFGGSVALRLLAENTLATRSVTSIGGSGGPWKTAVMKQELSRWDGSRTDLARILRFLMDEGAGFESQLEARMESACVPGHYRAIASAALPLPAVLRQPDSDSWPEALRGNPVPVLLVAGENDALFAADWPERIAERLPRASVRRIASLHSPNLDRANELTRILIDHFDGSDPTNPRAK